VRVALTGPDGDAGSLGEGLRAYGLETASFPLLEASLAADLPGVEREVRSGRGPWDFVGFTSPRAVDALARLEEERGIRVTELGLCFAVGPETARRAAEKGWSVAAEGPGPGAAALLGELDRLARADPLRGKRVLLSLSDRARTDLADGLRERGAIVDAVVAYAVKPPEDLPRRVGALLASGVDAAVLASPSAAEALVEGGGAGTDLPLVALGPTTAEAMARLGLPVAATAERPTPLGLWNAMEETAMGTRGPGFPAARPRRLRRTGAIRRMVRETTLEPRMLVAPMFVVPGSGVRQPVPSMPGVERVSPDEAAKDAEALAGLGVGGAILFGIPDRKDAEGSAAWDPEGPVCRALSRMRDRGLDLVLWADVCLCEYTDHGHCGLLDESGAVRNDETLPLLARAAVAYARAGADAVAPSDMMDGRVRAIRGALDREGLADTLLVSYAVKYASGFYGPFRDAAGSAPRSGDRRAYQMDPANAREALREAALDEAEGADVLMVKPALAYLDVIRQVRDATTLPVAAYNVSGEYAMVKAASERGWIDGERVMLETLTAVRRAGADLILTYHAAEAARRLQG
jgi:porphobilinogen synthase